MILFLFLLFTCCNLHALKVINNADEVQIRLSNPADKPQPGGKQRMRRSALIINKVPQGLSQQGFYTDATNYTDTISVSENKWGGMSGYIQKDIYLALLNDPKSVLTINPPTEEQISAGHSKLLNLSLYLARPEEQSDTTKKILSLYSQAEELRAQMRKLREEAQTLEQQAEELEQLHAENAKLGELVEGERKERQEGKAS